MINCKEVSNYKLITPAALQELLSKGLIKLDSKHRAQVIYTRNTTDGDAQLLVKMHEQQVPPAVHFEK